MEKFDARKLDHKTLEAIRIQAVRQVQNGQSPENVIRALGFTRRCIYLWLAAYRAYGWDGLRAGRITGRPKKLNDRQIKWIYNAVTSKNPVQLKFSFALWTRPMIRTLIWRRYRIELSLASVGRLLAQLGLTCQKPLARAFEQDPTRVKQWLEKEYPKIKALAKRKKAEVFFADESGVRSDFHSGTTWALKGRTPVVKHTGRRFSLNMISAVSPKGSLRFMVTRKRIGSRVFVEFLRRLVHGRKRPIFLIVDGHPSHKGKLAKSFLKEVGTRLRVFFLPPYAPELNPDEYVWNDVKNNAVGRSMVIAPGDLKSVVRSRLRYLQRNPTVVRKFFQSKTTCYAA